MQTVDTIIKARWLIPVDDKIPFLDNHAVVINKGKIIDLLKNSAVAAKYHSDNIHDLTDHAVLPGFINAHTHLSMSLMRGFADDLPLMTWLEKYIWPAEKATVNEEFTTDGSKHAMAEMLKSGTTCFNELHFFASNVAKLAHDTGMRGRLAETVFNFATPWSPTPRVCFDKTQQLIKEVNNYPNVYASVGPHSPYGTDDEIMQEVANISKAHNLPIHIHLHESDNEIYQYKAKHGMRPLARFEKMGWCSNKLQAVHMTKVIDEDIAVLKRNNIQVIHCPESNMKISSGACPVQELLDHNINVALATDGAATNNDLDMIGEMRSAAFMAKLITNNPESVSAETALRMATINAAKALHIDHEVGSLEVGKAADVIAINLNTLSTQPVYNPISQIVYSATRDLVTDVWVAGKQLLQKRKLLTLDEEEILHNAKKWQQIFAKLRVD